MHIVDRFKESKKKYSILALLCILYAGFAMILFAGQIYTTVWIGEVNEPRIDQNNQSDMNFFDLNSRPSNGPFPRIREPMSPIAALTSPMALLLFLSGILSFFSGISIWFLVREKEIKAIKQQTATNLLLPEENKVINALRKANYELTQSKLVKETGLTKVQVHRVLKRLEAKGAIEKHGYGLTNKILLKKEIFE